MTKEEALFLKSLANKVHEDISEYDLNKVFKLAHKHGVLPLCYENISESKGFDDKRMEGIKTKVFSIVFSQTKRSDSFGKIYQTLLNEGLKPIVLKGIILRQLYGDLCDHRPSGDEDILINREDFFKLSEILKQYGYIPKENVTDKALKGIEEITFYGKNGLNIEVHLNIIGTENTLRRKMNRYFEHVFDKAIMLEIGGQMYYTLDYTDHYIYLFYHMFKHFSTSGVGIRQVLDMFKFAEKYNDRIDSNAVKRAVCDINTQKLYGDIIEIGNKYMGFSMENEFGVTMPDRLIDDIFSAGAYGNDSFEQIGSKVKVMSALNDGKTSKVKLLFPPMNSMREHYKVLYDFPYLLPVMWVCRVFRYIFRSRTGRTYDILKSEKIADNKIALLKDYNII